MKIYFSHISMVLLLGLGLPFFVHAQALGLVGCSGIDCTWPQLIAMAMRIMRFLIIIAASLAAVSFAVAGWKYLTAAGDTGKIAKAHSIFRKVLIGFIILLTAYLIVQLLLNTLGTKPSFRYVN